MSSNESKGGGKFGKFGSPKGLSKFKASTPKPTATKENGRSGGTPSDALASEAEDANAVATTVATEPIAQAVKQRRTETLAMPALVPIKPQASRQQAQQAPPTSPSAATEPAAEEVEDSDSAISSDALAAEPELESDEAELPGGRRKRNDATSRLPEDELPNAKPVEAAAPIAPEEAATPTPPASATPEAPTMAITPIEPKPAGKAKSKLAPAAQTVKMPPLFRPDEADAPAPETRESGSVTLPPPPGYVPPEPPPLAKKAKKATLPPPAALVRSEPTKPPPIPGSRPPAKPRAADPFAATMALSKDEVSKLREEKEAADLEAGDEAAAAAAIADLDGLEEVETVENSFAGPAPVAGEIQVPAAFEQPPVSGQVRAQPPVSGQLPAQPPVSEQMHVQPPARAPSYDGPVSGQMLAQGPHAGSPSGQVDAALYDPSSSGQIPTPYPASYAPDHSGEFSPGQSGEFSPRPRPPRAQTAHDLAREASWKQAHPSARKWAQKRETGAARRTPNPIRIAVGLFMIAIGIYLLAVFIPDHEPRASSKEAASGQAEAERGWRFTDSQHSIAAGLAFGFLALGLFAGFRGVTYRKSVETHCGRCDQRVDAQRSGFAYRCLNGGHSAGLQFGAVLLVAGFFLLAASFLGLFLTAS